MTKRILAVVMAVILCMSVLSVNVFAANFSAKATVEGSTVTVSWDTVSGATSYTVTLYAGTTVNTTRSNLTGNSQTFTNLAGGSYYAYVQAYNGNALLEGTSTNSVTVESSSQGAGKKVTVTSANGNTIISWTPVSGGKNYHVDYTYMDGTTTKSSGANPQTSDGVEASSVTIAVAYANMRTVTVTYQNSAGATTTLDTWNYTNSGNSGGGYSTGNVGLNGYYLNWAPQGTNARYYINYIINGQRVALVPSNNPISATSYNVYEVLNRYANFYNVGFEVYVYGTNALVGTYYVNGNNAGSNYAYGIYVTPNYNNRTLEISWSAYTGADHYVVTTTVNGTSNTQQTTVTTGFTLPWTYGTSVTITVQAAATTATGSGKILGTIGSATVSTNGQISYNNGSNNNGGYWGNPGTTNGNVISGYNCTLTVGTTTSVLQWGTSVSGPYLVLAIPESGSPQYVPASNATNAATIPFGSGTSFQVIVYVVGTSTAVAQVSYTASKSNTGTDLSKVKSSITGLTVSATTASSTTISWAAVSGATSYEVEYSNLGSIYYTTSNAGRNTSFTLPYGKASAFEAYVYAWVNSRRVSVGSIVHVANDEFTTPSSDKKDDNKTDTTKPADTTPAYVTGFKGTVGTSGSITLAWNAASGKPTYEVYYKKTADSTWKKLYSTTSRSLKVNKLTNGTSYDFKVVANGRDSGILTMTIGTTSSTKTATDPGASSTTTTPTLSSVSGGKGSITVSWTSVSGANLYRVYIAEDGETTYKTKKTAWSTSGTSITLTGVSSGTYKVRIKASSDNGKTWTDLADCDYRTVTVS